MSTQPKMALRICAACERVFTYSSDQFFVHPKDQGHLICEDCAKVNGVEPRALGQ